MSRSTLLFIGFLLVLVVLLGYNYFARPFQGALLPAETPVTPSVSPSPQPVAKSLTTREKVWQVMAVPLVVTADNLSATESSAVTLPWILQRQPGLVTLFGEEISSASALQVDQVVAQSSSSAGLPIWLAVDHEGGTVQRLAGAGFTRLPSWQELCALDSEKRDIVLNKSAHELAESGIDVILAPVVDVASNSAVLGNRVCSSEPEVVVAASGQFIELFSAQGLLPVIKHFPGIGATKRDLHQTFDRVTVTAAEAEVYRQLLESFPTMGVMSSHAGVTNQYPDIPCSLSSDCIGELKSNFNQALVFSDALEMKAAAYTASGSAKTLPQISQEAISAGNDVLIYGPSVRVQDMLDIVDHLVAKAEADPVFRTRLDQAVSRVVEYKQGMHE